MENTKFLGDLTNPSQIIKIASAHSETPPYHSVAFANVLFENGMAASGGAVELENVTVLIENVIFQNSNATVKGGALSVISSSTVSLSKVKFLGNGCSCKAPFTGGGGAFI